LGDQGRFSLASSLGWAFDVFPSIGLEKPSCLDIGPNRSPSSPFEGKAMRLVIAGSRVVVVSRFVLAEVFRFAFAFGFQAAMSPHYRPKAIAPFDITNGFFQPAQFLTLGLQRTPS
jgi:hypothetical protein